VLICGIIKASACESSTEEFALAKPGSPYELDSQYKTKLARALMSMLRPLIRLCIRHEVTHAELTELVRLTYVEVAYDRYSIPDVDMSISRAAVLTGLSRKEVVRLRDALEQNEAVLPQKPNRAQNVVHGWLNDAEFLDEKDNPLTLPIKQKKRGKEYGSFVALVKRYSGDITYGAVLDELNHVGVTEQIDETSVALVNRAYLPHQDDLEQVRVIASSVQDLFEAALHNIDADSNAKRIQRQVVYSPIHSEFVHEIKLKISTEAKEVIKSLNRQLASVKKKSAKKKGGDVKRVGFGMYYIESETPKKKTINLFNTGANSWRLLVRHIVRCLLLGVIVVSSLATSACTSDPDDEGGVVGTGIVLRGSVTSVAGAPSATLRVKSADALFTELALDSNNEFSTTTLRGTGPWVLRASIGADRALYGMAYSDGTSNINSFSDLILRNWFAQQSIDLDTDFAASARFANLPELSDFMNTSDSVFGLLTPVLASYSIVNEDILSRDIIDNGQGVDAFLEQNTVIIENGLVSFVLTDPTTETRSVTRSPLALNRSFRDTGTTKPSVPSPGSLRALGVAADEIVLVWEPSTDDVAVVNYRVIRDGSVIDTTPYPVYQDDNVAVNQTFIYEIVAVDGAGNASDPSAAIPGSGLLVDDAEPPAPPDLLIELSSSSVSVQFGWFHPDIRNIVSFNVYRGSDAQSLELLIGVTGTSVTDFNVEENATYCYQVTAVKTNGLESDGSAAAARRLERAND